MTNRPPEFRYVYANGAKLQFTANDVIVFFGIREDLTSITEEIREEVGVAMTLSAAKLLAMTLTRAIEHFEATSGVSIPVESSRLEALEKILQTAALRNSSTS